MSGPTSVKRDNFDVASKDAGFGGLWALTKIIAAAVVLWQLAQTLLFQSFNIPSGSLIPSLVIGDYLFVSKFAYGYSHFSLPSFLDLAPGAMPGRLFGAQPKRGDIVVFKLPSDGRTDYIKRVIGLPGDKIQMLHGRLVINGALVDRRPLPPYTTIGHFGRPVEVAHYQEILPGGASHEIIQLEGDEGYYANTGVYEVPPGDYFMMGDNRDNSTDSRVAPEHGGVGFVPFENLVGRAELVFFSVNREEAGSDVSRWPWLVRWGRLFHIVR